MNEFAKFQRDQRHYRRIYLAAHEPPYMCHFCPEEVTVIEGGLTTATLVVHHVDHDRSNYALDNLVAAHNGCHVRYHNREAPERRAKISASLKGNTNAKGYVPTPEHRAKIGAAKKGKARSPEVRASVSAGMRAAPQVSCVKCRRVFRIGPNLPRHLRACYRDESSWAA